MQIGVVLLNWENAPLTLACLGSLWEASPRPERVVVVDSASRDDSVARIQAWAVAHGISAQTQEPVAAAEIASDSWLTVLRAASNRGFAIGNNLGLRFLKARTEVSHAFMLNNDTTVRSDCFAELRAAIDRVPDAGLVTGTIFVDEPGRAQVWYAGGREIPLRGLTAHVTELPEDDTPRPTEFVSGCAMLISRDALEEVGMLGECYEPFYGEDAEYSRRVREAGFPVIYAPRVTVYHKVGGTVGPARLSPIVTYSQIRHRIFFIRRNFRGVTRAVALAYTVLTKPGRALIETLKGRPRIAWAMLRGTIAGLVHDASG